MKTKVGRTPSRANESFGSHSLAVSEETAALTASLISGRSTPNSSSPTMRTTSLASLRVRAPRTGDLMKSSADSFLSCGQRLCCFVRKAKKRAAGLTLRAERSRTKDGVVQLLINPPVGQSLMLLLDQRLPDLDSQHREPFLARGIELWASPVVRPRVVNDGAARGTNQLRDVGMDTHAGDRWHRIKLDRWRFGVEVRAQHKLCCHGDTFQVSVTATDFNRECVCPYSRPSLA